MIASVLLWPKCEVFLICTFSCAVLWLIMCQIPSWTPLCLWWCWSRQLRLETRKKSRNVPSCSLNMLPNCRRWTQTHCCDIHLVDVPHHALRSWQFWFWRYCLVVIMYLLQVARLACSMTNDPEKAKMVRIAANRLEQLCPQVTSLSLTWMTGIVLKLWKSKFQNRISWWTGAFFYTISAFDSLVIASFFCCSAW